MITAIITVFLIAVLITGCKKTTEETTTPSQATPKIPQVTTSDINATIYESSNDTGISDIEITDEDLDVSV